VTFTIAWRRTLYVSRHLNDVKTKHGNRPVSARRGWAGEMGGFFSVLLDEQFCFCVGGKRNNGG
jgi:hypothetical protein